MSKPSRPEAIRHCLGKSLKPREALVFEIGKEYTIRVGDRTVDVTVLAVELPLIRVKESHGDSEYTVLNTASAAFYSAQRKRDLPPQEAEAREKQSMSPTQVRPTNQ